MSDCEGTGFCRKCNAVVEFFLSGSASKGSCMVCGAERTFKRGEVKVYYHQDNDDQIVTEGIE
jgi:hypothetical protein